MSIFTSIPAPKLKRSKFNLSHNYKFTGDFGYLYPILCEPVLPGDTWKVQSDVFMRMVPLIAPLMSQVDIYVHYFFVPNRLIWDNWKDFITGGEKGNEDSSHPYPVFQIDDHFKQLYQTGQLADYLGFPVFDPKVRNDLTSGVIDGRDSYDSFYIDALPFKAYQLIYNEYYRDENVTEEGFLDTGRDGVQSAAVSQGCLNLRKRAWRKDYFTSALPFPQRGDDVYLPLTGDAPVSGTGMTPVRDITPNRGQSVQYIHNRNGSINSGGAATPIQQGSYSADGKNSVVLGQNSSGGNIEGYLGVPEDGQGNPLYNISNAELAANLNIDLSKVNATTINELRRAYAAQRFLEAMARGGSRYIEQIYSIFGVRSSDGRLQRPEYLGGGKQPILVSDVLQTSETTSTSPQANQSGVGASAGRTASFKRFFEEHGYVIGILSVRPKSSYQQGMPRKYLKRDRYDFFWPQFANLGEQDIQNQELYFSPSLGQTQQEGTFGYTPRYAEYKHIQDSVHGDFRSNLAYWHLGRIFNRAPGLNTDFMEVSGSNRIFGVESENWPYNHLFFNVQHRIKALRSMPKYGVPKL